MTPDPFDVMRLSVLAIQTQNELAAARATIAALRKELAEAQENYHVTNSLAAKLQLESARLRKAGDAMCDLLGPSYAVREWNAAKEGKPSDA